MPEIRQLSPSVVNKIAAGEVIERPASVVKELMENAIDAGARRIDVTVEQGGSELVRVSDDGCGMRADQLLLSVASHATSKINDADDLFRVGTLGFRGEALASIAEVSHLRLVSRTHDDDCGAQLEIQGGVPRPITPYGCPPGTSLEVRHLFFNTPVRRKFLRTTQTELGHIVEAFLRIALPHAHVHCTLRHGDRLVHDLPPTESWRERIMACFGSEVGENLIWVESDDGDLKVSGYVGDPSCNRANNRFQYFFLNGRHIRDRSLQHALGEAYRGLLMQGRFAVAFLRWEMPPDAVDVNVHPTKLEVRFRDGSRVYSQLLSTIRNQFLATDLTARVRPAEGTTDSPSANSVGGFGKTEPSTWRPLLPESERERNTSLASWNWPAPRRAPDAGQAGPRREGWTAEPSHASPAGPHFDATQFDAPPYPSPASATPAPPARAARYGMQVHNRYLISESDEGLLVIDQHALHERILYEKLALKLANGRLESQRLLVPDPVTMTPAETAIALDNAPTLARLGIEIEAFGGDTVLITAYPAMLKNLEPAEILRHAVDLMLAGDGRADSQHLMDKLLDMMSCKAAVKAGDPLTPEEITALLEHRELCQDAHHCPHGRPTALVFTREELDKRFKRI